MKLLLALLFALPAQFSLAAEVVLSPQSSRPPVETIKQWKSGCKKNVAEDCYKLGDYFTDFVANELSGTNHYRKACGLKSAMGCYKLGGLLIKKEKEREAGAKAYASACFLADAKNTPEESRAELKAACGYSAIIKENMKAPYEELFEKLGLGKEAQPTN